MLLAWIFGSLALAILRAQLRARDRLRLRELLHEERMAALERGVAPIELPDLEAEIAALDAGRPERLLRRPLLAWAILLVAAGLGVCLAFSLSTEGNLVDLWPLGLIGILVGVGLLLSERLGATRRDLE